MESHYKTFYVNDLLICSILPNTFYSLINKESGMYQNPGVSLKSYIVAKCLNRVYVNIDGLMLSIIEECQNFSYDTKNISVIVNSLIENTELKKTNDSYGIMLSECSTFVKLSFDAFIMNQDPKKDNADIFSQQGLFLINAMLELNELLEKENE